MHFGEIAECCTEISAFRQFAEAHLCQSGHINDTHVVSCRVEDGSQVRYLIPEDQSERL